MNLIQERAGQSSLPTAVGGGGEQQAEITNSFSLLWVDLCLLDRDIEVLISSSSQYDPI